MKVIDYKKIDITDEEFDYYKQLVTQHTTPIFAGTDYFKGLFETDDEGFIYMITPKQSIPWEVLFFIQQVMINQRLRVIDTLRKMDNKK